jgi:hypothetical protein
MGTLLEQHWDASFRQTDQQYQDAEQALASQLERTYLYDHISSSNSPTVHLQKASSVPADGLLYHGSAAGGREWSLPATPRHAQQPQPTNFLPHFSQQTHLPPASGGPQLAHHQQQPDASYHHRRASMGQVCPSVSR